MKKKIKTQCAECSLPPFDRICITPGGKTSKGCPTVSKKTLVKKANKEYQTNPIAEFARQASIQEGECLFRERKRDRLYCTLLSRFGFSSISSNLQRGNWIQ